MIREKIISAVGCGDEGTASFAIDAVRKLTTSYTGMREKIIQEALTWQRTPWHHRACVKGAGVDCVFFLAGVYNAVGLTDIREWQIPYYPADIMLHRSEETVLEVIARYAHEVEAPQPGDVIVWRFGRIYSHAAIVVDYPIIIHASRPDGMVLLGDALKGEFAYRERKYFSLLEAV